MTSAIAKRVDVHRGFATVFLSLFLLTGALALLSACNTVHGAGEDLQKSSDRVKEEM